MDASQQKKRRKVFDWRTRFNGLTLSDPLPAVSGFRRLDGIRFLNVFSELQVV